VTNQPPVDHGNPTVTESTGDGRVDTALARLGQLDDLDLDEHAQVFDEISASLQDVLDEDPLDRSSSALPRLCPPPAPPVH